MHIRHLLPVLIAAAASLEAQSPLILLGADGDGMAPREDIYVSPVSRPWTAGSAPNAIGRTFAARVTGHTSPDVLMFDGDQLIVATAPGIHRSMGAIADPNGNRLVGLRDAAVLVGRGELAGGNPAHDALALASNAGLQIWRRSSQGGRVTVSNAAGGSAWNQTTMLATHPADPTAIYGIDPNGTLRVALREADGSFTSHPSTTTVSGTPLAIGCIDWNNDLTTEVAVVTTLGFSVWGRTGSTPIYQETQSSVVAAASLTLVRGNARPEVLAWLTPSVTTSTPPVTNASQLRMRGNGITSTETLGVGYVGAAAYDWSGDGNPELLLSTSTNNDVAVLVNIWPVGPVFQHNPAVAFRVATAAADGSRPANRAPAITADFDGDGDGDLIVPIAAGASTPASLSYIRSRLNAADPQILLPESEDVTYTVDPHNANLATFQFEVGLQPGTSDTELVVWREELAAPTLFPVAVTRQVLRRPLGAITASVAVTIDRNHVLGDGLYVIMLRPVVADAANQVTIAGVPTMASLWATPAGELRAAFEGGMPISGGVKVGGIVPRPDLPPAPPGNPPSPQ